MSIVLVPLIRKDGGPAFFVQKRVGKNGRYFNFYKFRSMRVDAEEIKKDLMAQNTMTGGMFKMENDPRVTPVGRFIRKTSLDELPQFYNVLIGDMSLVGTRPPTVDEYQDYTPAQTPTQFQARDYRPLASERTQWDYRFWRSGQTRRCVYGWLDDLERYSDPAQDREGCT